MTPGTQIGPYEILGKIGAGGMGEVYRARDTRLGREVAIKVLPASFSSDPERLRRFEQEARATGMLNHPNVLAVYDVGTYEDSPYLVTELLEGHTLREEMPVPRRKALDYARQIAAGLAAAHGKGVAHRDLKPDNLFVTLDGRVKILDFGLAKVEIPQVDSELTRSAVTTPGIAMGTVGYMSPEQARGTPSDHRSDIFSFGAILYEMLSGKRPFHRDSTMDTMSAILKEDPPPLDDPALDPVVRRCLEKSAEQRFQSASDLGFAIQALTGSMIVTVPSAIATAPQAPKKTWPLMMMTAVVAVLCLALGVAAGIWWRSRSAAAAPEWRAERLTGSGIIYGERISPDGRTLAFIVVEGMQGQVAVMHPGSANWTVLTHNTTHGEPEHICWSRDGAKLYFARRDGAYSVPALGGEERLVLEQAMGPEVLPDGSFLVARINAERRRQVFHYYPETGKVDPLDLEVTAQMRVFPDGKEAVSFVRKLSNPKEEFDLRVFDVTTGKTRLLPMPANTSSSGDMAVSPDGKSVLLGCTAGDLQQVIEIPANGKGKPHAILTVTEPIWNLDVAPDGQIYIDQVNRPYDVLRYPVSGGAPEQVVEASAGNYSPITLPDGRVLLSSSLATRETVLVVKPGQNPVPFVETEEETRGPLTVLGAQQVALRIGKSQDWVVAIASSSDGRILRRLESTRGRSIFSMSGSSDGKTLYYAGDGTVWALSAETGEQRKLGSGDWVAANPNGQDVVVSRQDKDGVHLARIPVAGGAEQSIPYASPLVLSDSLGPAAVRADGKIAVTVLRPDSWWDESGILDPKTGQVTKLNVPYSGDAFNVGWTQDGRMISTGLLMRGSLWRFQR